MARKGENIYKRKDGRWEGRYINSYDADGKAKYGYIYAKSYSGVREKLIQAKTESNCIIRSASQSIDFNKYDFWLKEWLYRKKISVKESTYIRYRNMHNYYKVLNLNFYFFRKSIAILFLSVISNLVAYYTFGTMESISYASVIIMLIWYLITEKMLKNKYNVSSEKNFCYLLLIMFSFYICSCVEKVILGMFGYIILYSAITCIFYKDIIREMIKK